MMALILVGVLLLLTHQSQALSTPSTPSPLRKSNINDDAIAKRTVSNIFSVVSHIQNPNLYQPSWADNTRYEKGTKTVVPFFCFLYMHLVYAHLVRRIPVPKRRRRRNSSKNRRIQSLLPMMQKEMRSISQIKNLDFE